MDKLHSYQGWLGRFHEWRESLREQYTSWREENPQTVIELLQKKVYGEPSESSDEDYSHIYRFLYVFSFQTTFCPMLSYSFDFFSNTKVFLID